MLMLRPAAGGESCLAGFLFMGNVAYKIIMRTRRMGEFDNDNGGFV